MQLYAEDTANGVTLPAQQLIGFARVDLEPGETSKVRFALPLSVLAYTGAFGELVMEPGPIALSIGSSSSDLRSSTDVEVTGGVCKVKGEDRAFFSTTDIEKAKGPALETPPIPA